jgi:transglutaminase-like putative cysteine protease
MLDLEPYLRPTWFLDSDAEPVREFAQRGVGGARGELEKAVALYYAVRDGVRYDPYVMRVTERESYRASTVATLPAAYCIQKSILYAAAARAVGVPARLGYADVRNHLTSPKLRQVMGSDLFVYHGYTELYLEDRWVKATAVFNIELCRRFGVLPLDFDGRSDSLFHPFDAENRKHMEYVRNRGCFADVPFEEIMAAFHGEYPSLFRNLEGDTIRDEVFRPAGAGRS